ncbi:MAG: LD-carboxypeptidase [Bacillota bacterium]
MAEALNPVSKDGPGDRPGGPAPGGRLKPTALKPGDLVAVVAPAGRVRNEKALAGGVRVLEHLGFRVVLGRHLTEHRGYLAGPDEARADDLNRALADPEVRGIVAARGGYGASRILPLVDYAAARNDPKVFVGYSDLTALHLAFARETGLVTFHGPVVESLGERLTRFTLDSFVRAVTSTDPLDVLPVPDDYPPPRVVSAGRAVGPLAGGNLSLVAGLLGTPYELDARGRVLILEDVREQPYRIDRMLTQLVLSGALGQAAGVALGEMVACEPAAEGDEDGAPWSLTVDEVIADHLAGLGRPVLSGLPCGHGRDKWTLPLGVAATLDGYKARLIIEEAACG